MGLDLYARIEPLLGFEEEKRRLYEIFLDKLEVLGVHDVLDIGCGSGAFMELAQKRGFSIKGIDISCAMVERARARGFDAECMDVCEMRGSFEAAVAVFDVINYMDHKALARFFACVRRILKDGGYFLCDMNTLYGFEEVAQGTLLVEREDACVAIEAEFADMKLFTKILHFYKQNQCYRKEKDSIIQYYHDVADLKRLGLKLVDIDLVSLFAEEADKALLVWQKD